MTFINMHFIHCIQLTSNHSPVVNIKSDYAGQKNKTKTLMNLNISKKDQVPVFEMSINFTFL